MLQHKNPSCNDRDLPFSVTYRLQDIDFSLKKSKMAYHSYMYKNPGPVPRVTKFTIPAYCFYQLSLSDLYKGAEKKIKKNNISISHFLLKN